MANIEIEIKSLLGDKKNLNRLIKNLKANDENCKVKSVSNQLNHYFIKGNISLLYTKIKKFLNDENDELFKQILESNKNLNNQDLNQSVRTRKKNKEIILIIKSTVDNTTHENGTARIELEIPTLGLTLNELDNILLSCNFEYQAKWSRARTEYNYKDYTVCIDKNAGYGYLAEFEKVVTDKNSVEKIKKEIRNEMEKLNIKELSSERLEKMFNHYNSHWQEYYGTDKIFTIY